MLSDFEIITHRFPERPDGVDTAEVIAVCDE